MKKYIFAAAAGGASMWSLAGLWHLVLMPHFYATEAHATHEGSLLISGAYAVLGALMAHVYPKYVADQSLTAGIKFGALIGLLWVFPHGLVMAGAHGESVVYVFKNAAWHLVEQGVGGGVIAFVSHRR